jgi:hypothetical protein
VRFINAYLARVFRAAEQDPAVARAFLKVAHLVAPPPSLFAPGILMRVLRGARRAETSRPLGQAAP